VLTVHVDPHPVFHRKGDDLHTGVSIGMIEAALGGHVEVTTPDGPVTIEVPAGTQTGQQFRLLKRGVPRLGDKGRGDLWVQVEVVVPAVTGDRGRALLRELQHELEAASSGGKDEKEAEHGPGGGG
jgi:molecular chaperone DnaJ